MLFKALIGPPVAPSSEKWLGLGISIPSSLHWILLGNFPYNNHIVARCVTGHPGITRNHPSWVIERSRISFGFLYGKSPRADQRHFVRYARLILIRANDNLIHTDQ